MLTKKQINEIKEHLEKSQNPLFFFDNDPDGLCSFLLLSRFFQKGKGVPLKGGAKNIEGLFRKVREFESDYIFILDKPYVPENFFKKARDANIPVVWIDHHLFDKNIIPKDIYYYNPILNLPEQEKNITGEPVTALCYQITQEKKDLWIAVTGCISDMYLPFFYGDFIEKYPDLGLRNFDKISDIYYKSGIGTMIKLMSNGLKDKTTNVIAMLRFLIKAKNPYEFINESEKNRSFHSRSKEIEDKKRKILEKAKKIEEKDNDKNVLFFEYGGDLSMSSELSNELRYIFPDKVIAVIYTKGEGESNISIRGDGVRDVLLKVLDQLEGAVGGGHEKAVGGKIKTEDVPLFKKKFLELF